MNECQRLWWEQTRADQAILLLLRQNGALPCHQLHYLQMVTEKLGKAYFWRTGKAPPKSHVSFVRFMQALDSRSNADRAHVASLLGFGRVKGFASWISAVTPLAYALERLAPALAGDQGPNPEYPWPRLAPVRTPANYLFPVWKDLTEMGRGRQLPKVIDLAVVNFPQYG
jgi:hypothetical protein